MESILNKYNPGGVDESVLGGTGPGGLLSSGYLRDGPLASYVGSEETAVFVRSNAKHGVYREGDDDGHIAPGDDYRAFAIVTDARIVIVVGDTESGPAGDRGVSVPLADVELVESSDGLFANELAVLTRSDVRWRFPCREDLEDLTAYLEVATMTWKQVETGLEAARKAVVDAEQSREEHDYDDALRAVDDGRDAVEAAREREAAFVADGVPSLSARIERAESRVAEAAFRTHRARATHHLDRAEQRWREDDYAGAHVDFCAAHDDYVAALEATDDDFDGTESIRKSIARVERNLTALERAPVERAEQACERAYDADDPADRADALERALERYRRAIELDWGSHDERFVTDTAELRERVDAVAADLVETRRRLAAQRVREGDAHQRAGRTARARDRYREARDLLEATLETARELVPDETEDLAAHLEAVERKIRECTDGDVASPVSGD